MGRDRLRMHDQLADVLAPAEFLLCLGRLIERIGPTWTSTSLRAGIGTGTWATVLGGV